MCPGSEHEATSTTQAQPSFCTLPIFHLPAKDTHGVQVGYTSNDGHHFLCRNPAVMKQAFHVIFAIDRSGSMNHHDRRPLQGTPNTVRISRSHNNRLGAVYSSLDGFWTARGASQASNSSSNPSSTASVRRDAYSVVLFNSSATTALQNDFGSSPATLLDVVLRQNAGGGTRFVNALAAARQLMENHWSTER
jgi:hypothetical protein